MKVLVSLKRTKWERDIRRYKDETLVREIYKKLNDPFEKVFESHTRQIKARELLRKSLPEAIFAYREDMATVDFSKIDLIVSLGGDNHFVYTSAFAYGIPIVGVNSDPLTSAGALLYFNTETFVKDIGSISEDETPKDSIAKDWTLEEWTRINGLIETIDGKSYETSVCVSEISIRNSYPEMMSRYLMKYKGMSEEQKSSGYLLSTGTGSTGWYRNCLPDSMMAEGHFPRNAPYFRGVARELRLGQYDLERIEVGEQESLTLISEMEGTIVVDAHEERGLLFPPGAKATFRLSKETLKVVRSFRSLKHSK